TILSHICFFFQAEDGIRDRNVTRVQTCALPILRLLYVALTRAEQAVFVGWREADHIAGESALADLLHRGRDAQAPCQRLAQAYRSEERRVGIGCRSREWR